MLPDDHFIHSRINITKERAPSATISYRKIKNIKNDDFERDLTEAVKVFDNPHTNDLDELIHLYNQALGDMLNTHAPLKMKQIRITHIQPWFCNRIKSEIILIIRRNKNGDKILQNITTGPSITNRGMLQT